MTSYVEITHPTIFAADARDFPGSKTPICMHWAAVCISCCMVCTSRCAVTEDEKVATSRTVLDVDGDQRSSADGTIPVHKVVIIVVPIPGALL